MATYKVPQDVEAEDKLIGPFSFRQFIYLIVAAIAGGVAYGLSRIAMWLVVVPMPLILFFLVLALPLKKDQPFEVYLAAMIRFLLKPKLRMWEPEGNVRFVQINSSKPAEEIQLKEFSGDEAAQKLEYLANIVDTGGWASRGVSAPVDFGASPLNDTILAETDTTEDVMDDATTVVQSFDTLLEHEEQQKRDDMAKMMQQAAAQASIPLSSSITTDFDLPAPIIAATPPPNTTATDESTPTQPQAQGATTPVTPQSPSPAVTQQPTQA